MKRQYEYLAAILTCVLVCGCGQKGALFLPGDRSQVQTELPPVDRDSLEGRFEDEDEEETGDVPDRPPIEDDDGEPLIDPAAPRPKPEPVPDADRDDR
jgi:predicted small lipoprotein YifL